MRKLFSLSAFFVFSMSLFSQKDVTTVGLQIKPIIPSSYLNTGTIVESLNGINFSIDQQLGYSFGMLVRRGYTEQISLEFGINYTRRNYDLRIEDVGNDFVGESDFTYIIYEIPIQGLVYIRMTDALYMNVAMGGAFDILPTNWESNGYYFGHLSRKKSWLIPALLANVGFEYRTRNKGYFYLGASFHRPFMNITQAVVLYEHYDRREIVGMDVNGNYLTIDFRYFFHEKAERR